VANAGTVQLFDASNNLIATRTISTSVPPGFTFTEALFTETSAIAIKSVRLSPNSAVALPFVIHNLPPATGAAAGPGDWYGFAVNAGDSLSLQSKTPADGPGQFVNTLNPKLELYDPSGVLVASGVVLGDGRNESISYSALATGLYRLRVL